MSWNVSALAIGLAIAHGITIGLFWDEIVKPDGLQIGGTLE